MPTGKETIMKKHPKELNPRIIEICEHIEKTSVDGGYLLRIDDGKDSEGDGYGLDPVIEVVDLTGQTDPFWIEWHGGIPEKESPTPDDIAVTHFF